MRYMIVVLALMAESCRGASPTAPASPSVPTAPPVGSTAAVLTISTFTVAHPAVPPSGDGMIYDVKLRISEASGKSGANLQFVQLEVFGSTDVGCTASERIRIDPGTTWDMSSLGYCAPEVFVRRTDGDLKTVTLTVPFTDDAGHVGSLKSTAVVTAFPVR